MIRLYRRLKYFCIEMLYGLLTLFWLGLIYVGQWVSLGGLIWAHLAVFVALLSPLHWQDLYLREAIFCFIAGSIFLIMALAAGVWIEDIGRRWVFGSDYNLIEHLERTFAKNDQAGAPLDAACPPCAPTSQPEGR